MVSYLSTVFQTLKLLRVRFRQSSLRVVVLSFGILVLIGTVVYSFLEGWTLREALYATVITITTVGYGDYSPQTPLGQLFAIVFTLVAIGLAGYAISSLAAVVFEYESTKAERRLATMRMNKISELQNHTIICGAGTIGYQAANEFRRRKDPFILIEKDEAVLKSAMLWMHEEYVRKFRLQLNYQEENVDLEVEEQKSIAELAAANGIVYLLGDPTEERLLLKAGIGRAVGLITALDDDRDNISIILSARDMVAKMGNQAIRLVSVAKDRWSIRRIYLAGATKVVSPGTLGGLNLATHVLDPHVGEMWHQMLWSDTMDARMRDYVLAEHPEYVGLKVIEFVQATKLIITAVKRGEEYEFSPSAELILQATDILIVFGSHSQ
ncbi:MAG TPA: potassium channel protein [Anaerolineae bacterium]|nr:potassium channel protein [Anaerolineae bacterium]